MPEPGELIHSADYAFSFRTLEPRPDAPHSMLVLLHGVGGDETQLVPLGARMPGGTLVVLPRGYRSISGGQWGWYRIGLGDDGVQLVEDEEREARGRLVDFLGQLQRHFDVPPARTVVGGFSQGGILAGSTALTTPGSVAGFLMLSGRLVPEVEPEFAESGRLRHLQALVLHGADDPTLPVEDAEAAARRLVAMGIDCAFRRFAGGHELGDAMLDAAVDWLRARLDGSTGNRRPDDLSPGPRPHGEARRDPTTRLGPDPAAG